MVAIDYDAHQEQYEPDELLRYAELAEAAGFDMIWTSDHFHPWFHSQGSSGFAWSWLGALCERVDLPMGTCVTPTTGHYHPGIVAQAFATLQVMHDERVVLGLSTGEAMNEKPLGFPWPDYPERRQRLKESLEICHHLWESDDFVDYDGEFYRLDGAKLYTRPETPPEVHVAANGPSTASLAGEYCDGFITVLKDEEYTDKLYPAVRRHAEEADRDPDAVETTLLVTASYDEDYERAYEATKPWWAATQDVFSRGLYNPKEIEAVGDDATREEVEHKFLVADDPAGIAAQLEEYAELGFDRITLGNTSPEPETFFEVMGDEVIPSL
ncbi:TIGR03557 family F420-dependent LLM class oxidoreductase [Haloarcula nitratireducens]|uniref:TIGR03557 family F420-dependent LLM class oxidoreductase n=1 Tax=Haloarcula nitratireducens TaxID=2487749 RepID=A0AAW4PE16_9EURY|nr:TIGR03557 family F420-dependent LLM class oxidoreductase [Halomicroarcula nitratireducens]MBX0296160.1 TIGR03557 family F420-dependent LLM class oxidoreductase [Halomicroarcula nitratireducens]